MTSSISATNSIEATTALLQVELPQLEQHQQALEKELATVSERLESVRGALAALHALSATTVPRPRAATVEVTATAPATEPVTDVTPALPHEPAPAPTADDAAPQRTTAVRKTRKAPADTKKKAARAPRGQQAPKRRSAKQADRTKTVKAEEAKDTAPAPVPQDAAGLTDQVIAVLAQHPDTPLRARYVAQALGRDDSLNGINTVRSTLDRLVATSRAHRAGRGLYQAPTN